MNPHHSNSFAIGRIPVNRIGQIQKPIIGMPKPSVVESELKNGVRVSLERRKM
jgi:hypothetical protein